MIRKRIISKMLFAGAALAVLASCSESYPGIDYDKTQGKTGIENQDNWSDQTPILVFVNEQNIFSVKTRGMGAFESEDRNNEERLANSTFYVYAFRNSNYESGIKELREPTDFSWYCYAKENIKGHGPDSDNLNCLLDGHNYNYGWPMNLHPHGTGRLEYQFDDTNNANEVTPYYSTTYQGVPYDFFAYYMDDAKVNAVNRTKDGISYDIEIDGTQDVMCGYAPNLQEELKKGVDSPYYGIWSTLSTDERNAILNAGGYCTQAAHRGIHPSVDIKHCLTQLTFTGYPGDESSSRVTITRVTVTSQYQGTFKVASRNLDEIGFEPKGNTKELELRGSLDENNELGPLNNYTIPFEEWMKGVEWYRRPSQRIGTSIMPPPAEEYVLAIYYNEEIPDKIGESAESKPRAPIQYRLTPPEGFSRFEPGYTYDVKIAIYGTQKIEVYCNVAGWENGGDVHLEDPDDAMPRD